MSNSNKTAAQARASARSREKVERRKNAKVRDRRSKSKSISTPSSKKVQSQSSASSDPSAGVRTDSGNATVSKHDQILELLRRSQGASLEEMQKASGWRQHSVRGFLSGTVKKRLGFKLQSTKSEGGERRYMIVVV